MSVSRGALSISAEKIGSRRPSRIGPVGEKSFWRRAAQGAHLAGELGLVGVASLGRCRRQLCDSSRHCAGDHAISDAAQLLVP